jgi:hypothetical protein
VIPAGTLPIYSYYNLSDIALCQPDPLKLRDKMKTWVTQTFGDTAWNSDAVKQLTMTIISMITHIWRIGHESDIVNAPDPNTFFKAARFENEMEHIEKYGLYTEGLMYAKLGIQVDDSALKKDIFTRIKPGEQLLVRKKIGIIAAKQAWFEVYNKSTTRCKLVANTIPYLDMTSTCKSGEVLCMIVYFASIHRVLVLTSLRNNQEAEGNQFKPPAWEAIQASRDLIYEMLYKFFSCVKDITKSEMAALADAFQHRYLQDCYCYGIADSEKKGTPNMGIWTLHHLQRACINGMGAELWQNNCKGAKENPLERAANGPVAMNWKPIQVGCHNPPSTSFFNRQINIKKPLVGSPELTEREFDYDNRWLTRRTGAAMGLDMVHGSFVSTRYLTEVQALVDEWHKDFTISRMRLSLVDFSNPVKAKSYGSYMWGK